MLTMWVLGICAYIFIGILIGRAWNTMFTRRGNSGLELFCGAVGVGWPFVVIIVPVVLLLTPTFRWLFKHIDRAVVYLDPSKSS